MIIRELCDTPMVGCLAWQRRCSDVRGHRGMRKAFVVSPTPDWPSKAAMPVATY